MVEFDVNIYRWDFLFLRLVNIDLRGLRFAGGYATSGHFLLFATTAADTGNRYAHRKSGQADCHPWEIGFTFLRELCACCFESGAFLPSHDPEVEVGFADEGLFGVAAGGVSGFLEFWDKFFAYFRTFRFHGNIYGSIGSTIRRHIWSCGKQEILVIFVPKHLSFLAETINNFFEVCTVLKWQDLTTPIPTKLLSIMVVQRLILAARIVHKRSLSELQRMVR